MLDKSEHHQKATEAGIAALMQDMGERAKNAAQVLAIATTERKHAALIGAAEALRENMENILDANAIDMESGKKNRPHRFFP